MKLLATIVFLLEAVAGAFGQGSAQSGAPAPDFRETKLVAFQALGTLQELGRRTTYKEVGFETIEELARAKLDDPLAVFVVELNDLRAYQTSSNADKLLKPLDKVIYPVSANSQVRTSIVLQKKKEGWKIADFGGANFARLVTEARDASVKANNLAIVAHFVVQVPALNAYFLGYRQDGKLMLVPLIDDAEMSLKAGVALSAGQAFGQLRPLAEKHDGLPR